MYIHISTCTLSAYAVFVLDGLRIKSQEQPARTKNFRLKSPTHRPLSSSFWGLPYWILNINHKKELLRGLWAKTPNPKRTISRPKSRRFRGVFPPSLGLHMQCSAGGRASGRFAKTRSLGCSVTHLFTSWVSGFLVYYN